MAGGMTARIAGPLLRVVWWCFAAVAVLLAVLLSAARLMLPGMSEYKAQIETVAERFIDRPVEIGTLDAAWRGLSPVLRLKGVVIHDPLFPDGVLSIEEVQVALEVIESLASGDWRTAELRVIGVQAALNTDLKHPRHANRLLQRLGWLLNQRSIALEDVSVVWTDPGLFSESLHLTALSLRLANEGGRHQFLAQAKLAEPSSETLKLAADFTGSVKNPRGIRGRVYLKTGGVELRRAAASIAMLPQLRFSGRLDLELWAGLQDGALRWGSGALALAQPRVTDASDSARGFSAERLATTFRWQLGEDGWQGSLREFSVQREGREVWPGSALGVRVRAGEQLRIRGHASRIVLDEVRAVLPLLPWIDGNALIMVERLSPRGQLLDSEFEFRRIGDAAPAFALRAQFEDLALAASEGLPGVAGLSGSIEGNLQAGVMRLDAHRGELLAPRLFQEPLEVTRLEGTLRWQRYANLFRIETERLAVQSGPLDLVARMQLDWPYQKVAPWLDLQLTVDALALPAVAGFVPAKIMSPKAAAWLANAFDAGSAANVRCLVQGRLDRLPFDANEGRLEASFDFSQAVLDYHPDWAPLHDLEGSAVFVGRSMRITGRHARLGGASVRRAVAVIDDLRRPVLAVEGSVGGALSDMLDYLASSPLGMRAEPFIRQVTARGDAGLRLALGIPLKRQLGSLRVDGKLSLQDNTLDFEAYDLGVGRISGDVAFTDRGVTADGVRAELLDAPVAISVYPWQASQTQGTAIDIEGPLDLAAFASRHQPALAPYVSGVADWRALLLIPDRAGGGEARPRLELRSDLVGLAVALPAPLAKSAEAKRETVVAWSPGHMDSEALNVTYGPRVHAAVMLAPEGGLRAAELRFGGPAAQLPRQRELRLVGRLEDLDGAAWIDVAKSAAELMPEGGGADLPPVQVRLAVGEASLWGYRFRALGIDSRSADPWRFVLESPDVAGLVRWSPAQADGSPRLNITFDRLVLNRAPADGRKGRPTRLARPQALPELDISVADLRLGEHGLGTLRLAGQRLAQGMRFGPLRIEGKPLRLDGQASWLEIGGRQSTHVRADITGGELAELVNLFGDSGSISGGELSGTLQLEWPGGPQAFDLATVEGEVHVVALDGRLVDVEEGAGKLLNLFNLNSLQRRLSLDFTDLTKGGLSFDRMEGHIVAKDGNAYTNDFTIRGSSAVIEIAGRTGLVARDYDQLVTVTPQLSASLPIASAIAGGPAVGAAVFLAERLVGDEFNRISQVQYQVGGSWDEPVYRRLRREERTAADKDGRNP